MAVDELLDEHEQGERVREWVRQNALGVFAGIGVALALVWAYGKWQDHRHAQRVAQGESYAAISDSLAAGDIAKAQALAAGAGLDEGVYGGLVALELAAAQVRSGDEAAAIATLSAARDSDLVVAPVVARRLAALQVGAGQPDEALATLGDAADAASLEIRGDAELAAGRLDNAREAYGRALGLLDEGAAGQRQLLRIKLEAVGGEPGTDGEQTP